MRVGGLSLQCFKLKSKAIHVHYTMAKVDLIHLKFLLLPQSESPRGFSLTMYFAASISDHRTLLTKRVAETPLHKQISRRLLHKQIKGR